MSVKRLTPEEIIAESKRVGAQMRSHTHRSLAGVYGVRNDDTGDLVGSGTYLNLAGTPFLLTAGHVLEAIEKPEFIGLAHSVGYGKPPVPLAQPYYIKSSPSDIGLARISASVVSEELIPADENWLANSIDGIESDILFIQGWPGEKSQYLALVDGIASTSLPYNTVLGQSSYDWFDPRIHFAIQYKIDGQLDEKGRPVQLPDPHGLCGSAIWKTNRSVTDGNWTSQMAQIVGIAIIWDQPAQSLIATRIEVVRLFIQETLDDLILGPR